VPTVTTSAGPSSTVTVIGSTTYPAAPAPTRTGSTAQCNKWYVTVDNDTCDALDSKYSITLAQLVTWNTYLNSGCTNLWPNYAICVSSPIQATTTTSTAVQFTTSTTAQPTTTRLSTCISTTTSTCLSTPAPIQAGAVANCKKFYFIVENDTCDDLAIKYSFTVDQFVLWNPDVGSNCNLWLSEWYCIAV
jgi:hypothetical protein